MIATCIKNDREVRDKLDLFMIRAHRTVFASEIMALLTPDIAARIKQYFLDELFDILKSRASRRKENRLRQIKPFAQWANSLVPLDAQQSRIRTQGRQVVRQRNRTVATTLRTTLRQMVERGLPTLSVRQLRAQVDKGIIGDETLRLRLLQQIDTVYTLLRRRHRFG